MTKNEYWKPSARNQEEELSCGVTTMSGPGACCVSDTSKLLPRGKFSQGLGNAGLRLGSIIGKADKEVKLVSLNLF